MPMNWTGLPQPIARQQSQDAESAISLKQLNRLQQRYNPPAEMRKGAPAGNFH